MGGLPERGLRGVRVDALVKAPHGCTAWWLESLLIATMAPLLTIPHRSMSMPSVKEFLRGIGAVAALWAALVLTGATQTLSASGEGYTCDSNPTSYCVATDGSTPGQTAPYNKMCTGGNCVTCVTNGGRCNPFGSNADIEGWWVGDP